MAGAYIDRFLRSRLYPTAGNSTTGKNKGMHAVAIYDGEFDVLIERCGINFLPHGRICYPIRWAVALIQINAKERRSGLPCYFSGRSIHALYSARPGRFVLSRLRISAPVPWWIALAGVDGRSVWRICF